MSDNKTTDIARQRIDLLHETDVAYWCRILNVSPEQLRVAVQHAGPQVGEVRHYLQSHGSPGTA